MLADKRISSVWRDDCSCWMHFIKADGWTLVLQDGGKEAILLLERGNGSEFIGTVSSSAVEKFIEFMERFGDER